jgi:hypothetical protein
MHETEMAAAGRGESPDGAARGGQAERPPPELVLDPDEKVMAGGAGYLDADAVAAREAFAAAERRTEPVVVAGEQFRYVLTSRGRLAIGLLDGGTAPWMLLGGDNPVQIVDTGALGDRGLIGLSGRTERTKLLVLRPLHGAPFRVIVPQTSAAQLMTWAGVASLRLG